MGWGKGGKGFGEHGLPNLAWALAWEGHASMHFFTRFPKGVVNPFDYSLPEGFTIERKWWGQGGDHWTTTHDVRYEGTHVNKRIQLAGKGCAPGSLMMWDGNKDKGAWIVKSWPQYALATPKGDRHIWYRGSFQFELNNGNFYSGYWEMDIHFRKPNPKMPNPYVVKFWPETWASKPHYWHFYEREEVEQSTYDKAVVEVVAKVEPETPIAPPVAPVVEVAPKVAPEVVPEAAPEAAPEVVAEAAPVAVVEAAPAAVATPVATPVASAVASAVATPVASRVTSPTPKVASKVASPVASQVCRRCSNASNAKSPAPEC